MDKKGVEWFSVIMTIVCVFIVAFSAVIITFVYENIHPNDKPVWKDSSANIPGVVNKNSAGTSPVNLNKRIGMIANVSSKIGNDNKLTVAGSNCHNDCSSFGDRTCSGNSVLYCADFNQDGCLELGSSTACTGGSVCLDGHCIFPQNNENNSSITNIICNSNFDCVYPPTGVPPYCKNDSICQHGVQSDCINPGTVQSYCNYTSVEKCETCADGQTCLNNTCVNVECKIAADCVPTYCPLLDSGCECRTGECYYHHKVAKPAVYLYPRMDSFVNVKLKINGRITKDIPEYKDGWNVFATKDGIIDNKYDYLFYEAELNKIRLGDSGWVVKYDELENWFDINLVKLGLNEKENSQFKEYWLDKLPKSNYYEIKLFENSFLRENMDLIVSPEPDTMIRLEFYFVPLDSKINIQEPKIITPERKGFTVVEWGGGILGNLI